VIVGVVLASALVTLIAAAWFTLGILGRRFRLRLLRHPTFTRPKTPPTWTGPIEYAKAKHPVLSEFRSIHNLEDIAGRGPETERLVRLMCWVHALTTHTPNPPKPERMNGLHLATIAKKEGKRFNCWMYATVLADACLSLGHPARILHLWPKKEVPNESHVVTGVYVRDLGKWVMLDPDMCAYVTDENGIPLGVDEIRKRMIRRTPLRVTDTIHIAYASWLGKRLLKRLYLWYLSKNIFRVDCRERSEPDYETTPSGRTYVHLIPDGYHDEWLKQPCVTSRGNTIHYIRDPHLFWQAPNIGASGT